MIVLVLQIIPFSCNSLLLHIMSLDSYSRPFFVISHVKCRRLPDSTPVLHLLARSPYTPFVGGCRQDILLARIVPNLWSSMYTRQMNSVLLFAALVWVPVVAARTSVDKVAVVRSRCGSCVVAAGRRAFLGCEICREDVGQGKTAHWQAGADDGDVIFDDCPECGGDVDCVNR